MYIVPIGTKEIIETLYPEFKRIAYRNCRNAALRDDLLQECVIIILSQPDERIAALNETNSLLKFFAGIVMNQCHSSNSAFYKKYVKDLPVQPEPIQQTNIHADIIDAELNKSFYLTREDWYRCEIVKKHLEIGATELSRGTGISRKNIYESVNEFQDIIRDRIKKYEIFMCAPINPSDSVKEFIYLQAIKLNLSPTEYIEKLVNEKKNEPTERPGGVTEISDTQA